MKAKFFLFALAVALAACNTNAPEKKELIGTWSEPYHVDICVKTFTFCENDTLIYTNKPDTTWDYVIAWGGEYNKLHYSIKNHKLCFSGERIAFDDSTSKFVREPFAFSTGYSVEGNMLTIDSFSYNGYSTYHKPVIVYKKQ